MVRILQKPSHRISKQASNSIHDHGPCLLGERICWCAIFILMGSQLDRVDLRRLPCDTKTFGLIFERLIHYFFFSNLFLFFR